jgi:HEAT repeat protein
MPGWDRWGPLSLMMSSVVAALLAGPAWAGPKRDAVMDLLNAFEHTAGEAELRALGDGVDAELMEIADDAAVPATRRGRAVSALQFYPTDTVRGFLERHLKASDALVRRKAAYSLAAFGSAAVPSLTAALSDADVQLRIAAASALGTIGSDPAKQALRGRLASEGEGAVKDAITRALESQ